MENSAVVFDTTLQPIDIQAISASPPFRAGYFLAMGVITPVNLLLVVLGITANIHNICVFFKTGSRDNVTVSFIALSMSDLLYLVLMSPHITVSCLNHLIQYRLGVLLNWVVDPGILLYLFYWYALVFYETSILITVYISVVRCACVAIPFKVKSTFTAGRAAIAFVIFFISVLLLRLPSLMKRRIVHEFQAATNTTRAMFVELDDGGLADKLNDIINRNILTWLSFLTVIACLVVMVTKLQASARFRLKASRTTTAQNISDTDKNKTTGTRTDCSKTAHSPPGNDEKALDEINASRETNQNFLQEQPRESGQGTLPSVKSPITTSQPQAISTREAQIIRSVVLVAAVFVTCQLPLMVYSMVRRLDSRFDDDSEAVYLFVYAFSANLSMVFSLINASINIFIYYNFNSRYRYCAKSLWKCNTH